MNLAFAVAAGLVLIASLVVAATAQEPVPPGNSVRVDSTALTIIAGSMPSSQAPGLAATDGGMEIGILRMADVGGTIN